MFSYLDPCPLHDDFPDRSSRHVKCGTLCQYHPAEQLRRQLEEATIRDAGATPRAAFASPPKPLDDGSNPKDRIGLTKPPLRLIPAPALIKMAMVMGLGASKYGPYNWREKKVRYTVYLEAALRHVFSALDGEEIDPESGQPHTAHAMACMAIILDAQATGNLVDDRPTPGVTAKLIAELTKKPT